MSPRFVGVIPLGCLLAAVVSARALGQVTPPQSSPVFPTSPPRSASFITFANHYGTVAFHGVIQKVDQGDRFEIRVLMAVEFLADAQTNKVSQIDLRLCQLVATKIAFVQGPVDAIYKDTRPISVSLVQDRETAWLPPLTFTVLKTVVADASHLGLGLSDGTLLWPLSVELLDERSSVRAPFVK